MGQAKEVEATTNKGAKAIKEPKQTKMKDNSREKGRGIGRGVLGTRPSMRKIKKHSVMVKNLCIGESKIRTERERER